MPVPARCLTVHLAVNCFYIESSSKNLLFRSLQGHEAGCVTFGPRGLVEPPLTLF